MSVMAVDISVRCKHCGRSNGRTSIEVCRVQGWRFFKGVSVTGKPLEDIVCPRCAGTAPEGEAEPSWRVGCNTCDWEYEDEDGGEPLTERDARDLARDHRCDPDLWIEAPNDGPRVVVR